nr:unnamed protein product [Callosobruchus chinensis]
MLAKERLFLLMLVLGYHRALESGLHRYVFLIYEQPAKLNFHEKRLPNTSGDNRGNFSIRKFAQKYKLGEPIAGSFYQ